MTPGGDPWYGGLVFRYVVLGLLRDGVSRHGYALMKAYRDRMGVQVSTGNFYRELQKLVAEGLVRSVARALESDPRQTPYEITESGAAEFTRWFADPRAGGATGSHEDQLSVRVLFLADVSDEEVRKVLEQWQDELWLRAKVLERSREQALANAGAPDGFPVLELLLARRLRHVAADVEFLEHVLRTYESWRGACPAPAALASVMPLANGLPLSASAPARLADRRAKRPAT